MLKSYVDLLKNSVSALTSLSIENASISDYFQAVGYEILLIVLGLLSVAIAIVIVVAPYFIFKNLLYKPYYKHNEFGMFMHELPNLKVKDVNYWYKVCQESFEELKDKIEQLSKINGGIEIYQKLEKLNNITNGFEKKFKDTKEVKEIISEIKQMESSYQIEQQRHEAFNKSHTYRDTADWTMRIIYFIWILLLIPLVLMFL